MLGGDRHRLAAVAASLALLGASLSTAAPSAVAEEFDPCDVGMHRYYGGNIAALEITGEGVFAIYPDQRVMLHTWPEGRAAAH